MPTKDYKSITVSVTTFDLLDRYRRRLAKDLFGTGTGALADKLLSLDAAILYAICNESKNKVEAIKTKAEGKDEETDDSSSSDFEPEFKRAFTAWAINKLASSDDESNDVSDFVTNFETFQTNPRLVDVSVDNSNKEKLERLKNQESETDPRKLCPSKGRYTQVD